MQHNSTYTPNRAIRKRNKPKKYGDFLATSPSKRRVFTVEESSDDEEICNEQCQQKPMALINMGDVKGEDMFKFKSRHTKLDLQNKIKAALNNSPTVLMSPLKSDRKSILKGAYGSPICKANQNTPKHVKDILRKRIIKEVESDSEESDFSASSSDFVPDHSESETESSSSSSEEKENVENNKSTAKVRILKTKDARRTADSEYIVTPDNYFMMNSSKKITTSDHTLARLKSLSLVENSHENVSKEHTARVAELNQSHEYLFNQWLYSLKENFNIILYGIGSKRSLLHEFQRQELQNYPCIVINGFFPSLTIKSVLETIIIELLKNTNVPSNTGDVVNLIDSQLSENDMHLFLIVHNIDGAMLRNSKAQAVLAALSELNNVHTIATIDHINALLLWDHSKLIKHKFLWWDVTTFLPYSVETSFENCLMTQRSGAQLSSLRNVFQSLTSNAKGIFNIIIQYQLENCKQKHYQGLLFKNLYSKCREQFLVSSDLALRAQLTEFLDHKLVKMKRTYDGSENLIIPIENNLLEQFLEQQDS